MSEQNYSEVCLFEQNCSDPSVDTSEYSYFMYLPLEFNPIALRVVFGYSKCNRVKFVFRIILEDHKIANGDGLGISE